MQWIWLDCLQCEGAESLIFSACFETFFLACKFLSIFRNRFSIVGKKKNYIPLSFLALLVDIEMNKLLLFAAIVLCSVSMQVYGIGAPVKREQTLLECTLHLTSAEPSKLCEPMRVMESTEGYVEVTLEYFFDTAVCLSFGAEPDLQNVQDWKNGYCHVGLFSFKRNHTIPFPAKDDPNNGDKKKAEKKTHTVTMSSSSFWGALTADNGHVDDAHSSHYFGALNSLASAANFTNYPSVSSGSGQLMPLWSSESSGPLSALQYYVGVGVTENDFWKGAYGSRVFLTVKQVTECVKPVGSPWAPVGPKCETATPMTLDSAAPVSLLGGSDAADDAVWVYYTLVVPMLDDSMASKLVMTLNVTRTDAVTKNGVNTYVRWQGLPYSDSSRQLYDAHEAGNNNLVYSTTLDSPRAGRYWIGLSTTKSLQYSGSLVARVELCQKARRYGAKCIKPSRFSTTKAVNNQVVKVTPSGSDLAYVIVNNTAQLVVSASSQAAKAPAIYLGAGFVPTTKHYTFKANTGDAVNRIATSTGGGIDGALLPIDWFVGVSAGNQQSLEVSVWIDSICALNCSEHGVCKGTADDVKHNGAVFNPNGECRCKNDDYIGYACQIDNDHDFKLEYIILIAVGGAIVLVIVIGVPVYCYIHKKKSRQSAYMTI
jgi:hypothetical protein